MQRMPERSVAGRSFASRRAIEEIVRAAVLGSYGVVGFVDDDPLGRIRRLVGLGGSGVRVRTAPVFSVELRLTVAFGLPVAEVARQVDSAVRYALRRALDREPDRLTIHVGRLRYEPSSVPPSSLPDASRETPTVVGHQGGAGSGPSETSETVRR
jgi:uncharacterized alkaline shock family protein YloU